MKKIVLFFLILFLFVYHSVCIAQVFSLKLKVVDASSKKPISFVSVDVNGALPRRYTDVNGTLSITSEKPIIFLVLNHIGFDSKVVAVNFDSVYVEMTANTSDFDTLTIEDIDSLNLIELEAKIKKIQQAIYGSVSIGIVDIETNRFLSINEYEGLRLGIGLRTNKKLSSYFDFGGYYAYGLKDKQSQYGIDLKLLPKKTDVLQFKIGYFNDVNEFGNAISGISRYFEKKSKLNLESYRDFFVNKMNRIQKSFVSGCFKYSDNLTFLLAAEDYVKHSEPVANYGFFDVIAGVKYGNSQSSNEKIIQQPELLMSITKGVSEVIDGGYSYNQYDFKIKQAINQGKYGITKLCIRGGLIDGDLPICNIYNARAAYRPFGLYSENAFMAMRMNEFMSDRYISLHLNHKFKGGLYNSKVSSPKVVLVYDFLIGDVVNNTIDMPNDFKEPSKSYMESGLVMMDVLQTKHNGIGVGFFYRHGAYSLPLLKDNLSYMLSIEIKIN